jgi:hypothetical protein
VFRGFCGTAEQAAEEGMVSSEVPQKHTSAAKARVDFASLYTGDESPAYRPNDFFSKL